MIIEQGGSIDGTLNNVNISRDDPLDHTRKKIISVKENFYLFFSIVFFLENVVFHKKSRIYKF